MKIRLSLCFLLFTTICLAQTAVLPFDFEAAPTTMDFINFDGGTATVLANPQVGGDNSSATAAQIVRDGGQIWAGSKVILAGPLDFSSETAISMQVYSPVAGITVKLKLEGAQVTERDQMTTVANAWETLTYDFSGEAASVFTEVVFMFDFGNLGDGSTNSTFLFDNVQQFDPAGGLAQMDLPVSFDDAAVFYALTPFEGATASLGQDPEDIANEVGICVKPVTAGTSAGVTIGTPAGFANAIPISASATKMTVRVFSPDAGIPVRLKIEDHTDPTRSVETEALTTTANKWDTLEFDFSNEAPGTAALNLSYTFDMASIFFNFGTDGATAGEKTYYFDDVRFGGLTSTTELEQLGLQYYPNPFPQQLRLEVDQPIEFLRVFNPNGQEVASYQPNTSQFELDLSALPNGFYLVQLRSAGLSGTVRVVKME